LDGIMTDEGSFSRRYGYAPEGELVYEDAPPGFRHAVLALADVALLHSDVLQVVRLCLGEAGIGPAAPDYFHKGGLPVAREMVAGCEWWRVYDIAEAIYLEAKRKLSFMANNDQYETDLNRYCSQHGIGWRMVAGHWQVYASDEQSFMMSATSGALAGAGKHTTLNELKQALEDLSRRPHADITGSIQHIGVAIECLARDLCGNQKLTLGEIINKHPTLFPGAYRKLVEGIWGIASNKGRHIHEGGEPTFNEAMLLVGVVTPLLRYLLVETGTSPPGS
jgi:hypothetical protein